MGKCDKKNTYEMLDFFYENGGNFIDTYVEKLFNCKGSLSSPHTETDMIIFQCQQLPKRRV